MHQSVWAVNIVCIVILLQASAEAVVYMESVDGDLSNVASSPTPIALTDGLNTIQGSTGVSDFDLATLSVPAGRQLASFTLTVYDGPSQSFVGMQNGTQWTASIPPTMAEVGTLLGWTHFGPNAAADAGLGDDLLDNIGAGLGATGFTPPLGAGDYTILLRDGQTPYNYQFDLNVIPEPSALLLVFFGFGAVFMRRRSVA